MWWDVINEGRVNGVVETRCPQATSVLRDGFLHTPGSGRTAHTMLYFP